MSLRAKSSEVKANAKSSPKLMEKPSSSRESPTKQTTGNSTVRESPSKGRRLSDRAQTQVESRTSSFGGISGGVVAAIVVAAVVAAIVIKVLYDRSQKKKTDPNEPIPVDFRCRSNADCAAGTFCADNGLCVECVSDAQCTNPEMSHCNSNSHTCVQCVSDTDCPSGDQGMGAQTCQQGTCVAPVTGHKHSAQCKH